MAGGASLYFADRTRRQNNLQEAGHHRSSSDKETDSRKQISGPILLVLIALGCLKSRLLCQQPGLFLQFFNGKLQRCNLVVHPADIRICLLYTSDAADE